jgi:uncharacterized protein (TIGR03067 family)
MLPGAILLTVGLTALAAGPDATKDDLKKGQGEWKIVAVELSGRDLTDSFKEAKATVKEDKVTLNLGRGQPLAWTIKLDATTRPKCVDFKNDKGETREGIYELKDDDLKVCVSIKASVAERPDDFVTREGSERILWKLRREKP